MKIQDELASSSKDSPQRVEENSGVQAGGVFPSSSESKPEANEELVGNRRFVNDVRVFRDGTASEPKLGFSRIAEKIVSLVEELTKDSFRVKVTPDSDHAVATENLKEQIEEPMIAIGIFGPWGAGKSTLLKAIKLEFEHPDRDYPCILVNSWKWDGKGDVHDYVRNEIRKYCRKEIWGGHRSLWSTISANLKILLRRYGQVGLLALLIGCVAIFVWATTPPTTAPTKDVVVNTGVGISLIAIIAAAWNFISPKLWDLAQKTLPNLVFEAGPAGLANAYRDIVDLCGNKPFVVFVDDLDRCSAERVVAFVECINNLTAIGCVTFIFCDADFVAAAINSRYENIIKYHRDKSEFGRRFLEKLCRFHSEYPLLMKAVSSNLVFRCRLKLPRMSAV